jgi:hypothetical protein
MVFFYCGLILIRMRKTSKDYYHSKGYHKEDLNIRGKPKRGLVSFQCEEKLWRDFDNKIEMKYGRYKKSYIIESLIRQYMAGSSSSNNNNDLK